MPTIHSTRSTGLTKRGNLAMMLVVLLTVIFTMMALLGYVATIIKDGSQNSEASMSIANVDASINAIAQVGSQYFLQVADETGDLQYDDIKDNSETILNLVKKYMAVTPQSMRLWYDEDLFTATYPIACDLIIISFTYDDIEYNVGFYVAGGQSEFQKGEHVFSWIS